MRNEPSPMLRKVWAMKEAAEAETRGLRGHAYFEYIRSQMPKLNLPTAKPTRRRTSPAK